MSTTVQSFKCGDKLILLPGDILLKGDKKKVAREVVFVGVQIYNGIALGVVKSEDGKIFYSAFSLLKHV
jgi:hypothetical protein